MKLLDPNSMLGRLFARLMDLVLLNVLWVLTSLPVITLGASTTALYDITMKMVRDEDAGIVRLYFRSFFCHLRRGTGLFLVAAAVGAFIALDFWAVNRTDSMLGMVSFSLILASGFLYLAWLSHLFPVLARFDGTVKETIRQSALLTIQDGIHSVWMVAVNLIPWVLVGFFPAVFVRSSFLWLAVGVALSAYLISVRLVRLFDPEEKA